MKAISKMYYQAIQKAMKAADNIEATEQYKKAMAFAAISQSIATAGLVEPKEDDEVEAVAETKETAKKPETKKATTNTKKDALKPEAGKGAKAADPVKEEVVEEVEAEVVPEAEEGAVQEETAVESNGEVEIEEEWTDAMCELKAESLERLNAYVAAWTEDYVYNTCVPAFFEDQSIVGGDNIRPTNVDGFVTYLDQIAAQA